jgi:hypothetical protein
MGNMDELITPKGFQKILGCSLPFTYKLAESGRIPCVRIPCPGKGTKRQKYLIRFKLSDIHKFIEEHYRNGGKK